MGSHIFLMLIICPPFRLHISVYILFFYLSSMVSFLPLITFDCYFFIISRKAYLWCSLPAFLIALGNVISMSSLQITLLPCMDSQSLGKYVMIRLAFSNNTSFHAEKNKAWDNWLPVEHFHRAVCDSQVF